MRSFAVAFLAAALLAGSACAADDVIAVSGQAHLEELIAKHPFLVAEVRVLWASPWLRGPTQWLPATGADMRRQRRCRLRWVVGPPTVTFAAHAPQLNFSVLNQPP